MNVKIATFAIILKNPVFDNEGLASELIEKGFEKKYYKLGLMKAYSMDGTEIPTKANVSGFSDRYQLLGNFCSVAFHGNEILLHHKFGIRTSEIIYDLKDVLNEIKYILHILKKFSESESKDVELILILTAKGARNPRDILAKWMKKLGYVQDGIVSDDHTNSEKIQFPNYINNRCTTKNIMVRNEEYAMELRFQSDNLVALCDDLKDSEKIGHDIILELENEN